MIVEKKNVTCESNTVSVARVYIYNRRVSLETSREVATFVGESVLYATVFKVLL